MQAIRLFVSAISRGIAPIQQLYNPLKLGVMGWVVSKSGTIPADPFP